MNMNVLGIEPLPEFTFNTLIEFLGKEKIKFNINLNKIVITDDLLNQLYDKNLAKNFLVLEDNDGSAGYNINILTNKKYKIMKDFILKETVFYLGDDSIPFYLVISQGA